ncbi:BrnA antitoxin family protein [Marinivivus vitaminiproducens]|nr:BrnA antitoxin family protein [Geminicoccaceae bacterium SCSIO 64248]
MPSDDMRPHDRADPERARALTDAEIEAAIAADPLAAPVLAAAWFRSAHLAAPQARVPVTLELEEPVAEWFRAQGGDAQAHMAAVLRAYVERAKRRI